jgi:pyruvate/2-oxoglutarate dehydrogenase complex dihydrolipoamide dehydrogenase (E3) component
MQHDFDFLAIGGGSAGFNGARVARGFSDRVAILDGAPRLGGLCILRGCMPSKTLLYPVSILHRAQKASELGLHIPTAKVDMPALAARKARIIDEFADYRRKVMESGRFTLLRSRARFTGPHTLALEDGSVVSARTILIATGSKVGRPPIPGLDHPAIWTSDEVLDLQTVPESVVVLGGGVVACELAQFLGRIGARVTVVQRSPRILKEASPEASAAVTHAFLNEGIEVITGTRLLEVRRDAAGFAVRFLHEGVEKLIHAPHVLNALGRVPDTSSLGLEAAGVELLPSGHIRTNAWQQTTAPHIYAGGDCAGPYEIVHVAVAQGELAARHAFGAPCTPVDHDQTMSVVFTDPPVATCGLSAAELERRKVPFLSASYPFDDHGKSILMDEKLGHVRLHACASTGRLLGAEIAGPEAGELIHILSTAIALRADVASLLKAPWYHPTLAEILTYPLEELTDALAAETLAKGPPKAAQV